MVTTLEPQIETQPRTAVGKDGPYHSALTSWAPAAGEPAWLQTARRIGLNRFSELGFPTPRDEDWRFTNLAPLTALPFRLAPSASDHVVNGETLASLPFAQLPGDRLVFVDGRFAPERSAIQPHTGGVVVTNLAAALETHAGALEPHLTRLASSEGQAFTALNEAFFTDGAFIHLPARRAVADPIRLVFIATGCEPGAAVFTRNLIVAGAASQATVIEQYISLGTDPHVTNAVTELATDDGAAIEHMRLQDENESAFHLAAFHGRLGRSTNLNLHSLALGARLSRYNIRACLAGEGIEAVLNGLYLADGQRLADHHMIVDHAQPNCASHEYFNGILADKSKGVFHGRILVRPGAQKTDAKQTNKNMLLSDEATADTKPQLEIYADDVKCTHGATIGQLHPEHIFYLRARGIPLETARRMLIHAFAGEIIDRVRSTPIRSELDQIVWDRLERHEPVHVGAHN